MPLPGAEHVRQTAMPTTGATNGQDALALDLWLLDWCPACGGTGREPEVPAPARGAQDPAGASRADCWWCRGTGVRSPRAGSASDPGCR